MSAALLAATAAVLSLAVGCGQAKRPAGTALFVSAGCGGCHTLAAASSHGLTGPNLDDLSPDYATVLRQITNGGNGMPSFQHTLRPSAIRTLATFVYEASQHPGRIAQFTPNKQSVSRCGSTDFACLRQAFGNIAFYQGPRTALAHLQMASQSNALIGSFCHQIAHEIGHAGYERYHGDAAEALSQGAMTCGSGYYHGVVERAFSGLPRPKIAATARQLCSRLSGSEAFILFQCVHGLGHGLMIYSGDDLRYSLGICDGLPTTWDQQSCDGGVFMQNFLTGPAAMVATRWVKAADLIYPCDTVADADKLYCYLQITDRILPAVGYDWTRAAAWCRRADAAWVDTCFQSLGRDASGFASRQPRAIARICRVAARDNGACIYGAVRDIADNDATGKRAALLCAAIPRKHRSRCFEGIGSILGALHVQLGARQTACDTVTPQSYRSACYLGAGFDRGK